MAKNREFRNAPSRSTSATAGTPSALPLASARWLLSVLLAVCCLALVCVYGTICLLYWQGQWQFSFPPAGEVKHAVAPQAAPPHEDIGFDATETGVLELHGWWLSAAAPSRYSNGVILFLHGGGESLAGSGEQLEALHRLGINVFAFDYRGFGKSTPRHPSEMSVAEDTDAAWRYLTGTRGIAPGQIVIYGRRLGAAIAAEAALRHPQCAGVVLESPQAPLLDRVRHGFNRLLPLSLIFHDRFNPAGALARLTAPKLFLDHATSGETEPLYYAGAASPKASVTLASSPGTPLHEDPGYAGALDAFLGKHLPAD